MAIYRFWEKNTTGDPSRKDILGGKGANLARMAALGLPVPPGLTLSAKMCGIFQENPEKLMEALWADLPHHLDWLVDKSTVCLYSVRSGAAVSMPGMMDTVLNIGITEENIAVYEKQLTKRTAWDCYRRLYQMYGNVVYGIPANVFDKAIDKAKKYTAKHKDGTPIDGVSVDDFTVTDLKRLVSYFQKVFEANSKELPQSFSGQIDGAVRAVFSSWNNERAILYRNANGIPHDMGTAVTVQQMVFGNRNEKSATGVMFTRNPQTGERRLMGEFLVNAQGEDVVAGTHTPLPIQQLEDWNSKLYGELKALATYLENEVKDMQDIEFTIENGKLWVLQTRNGKRSARAAVRIAWDMHVEERMTFEQACKAITSKQYFQASVPAFAEPETPHVLKGLPVCDGAVSGVACADLEQVKTAVSAGKKAILVRHETTPEDFEAMNLASAILTKTGGATSHAAVVARSMDTPCVVGATNLIIHDSSPGPGVGAEFKDGSGQAPLDWGAPLSVCGSTGHVWFQEMKVNAGGADEYCEKFLAKMIETNPQPFYTDRPEQNRRILTCMWGSKTYDQYVEYVKLACHGDDVAFFDLSPSSNFMAPQDAELLEQFGLREGTSEITRIEKIARAIIKTAHGQVIVKAPTLLSMDYIQKLSKAGAMIVREVDTMEDALSMSGYVEPSDYLVGALGSRDTWNKLLDITRNSGNTGAKSIPQPTSLGAYLNERLG